MMNKDHQDFIVSRAILNKVVAFEQNCLIKNQYELILQIVRMINIIKDYLKLFPDQSPIHGLLKESDWLKLCSVNWSHINMSIDHSVKIILRLTNVLQILDINLGAVTNSAILFKQSINTHK